jgi:hypothetical protein
MKKLHGYELRDDNLALSILQLMITVIFSNRSRPDSDTSDLTQAYFVVALIVNTLLCGGLTTKLCVRWKGFFSFLNFFGEFQIWTASTYGSFLVIALIHKVLVKRLEFMGRGKGLRRIVRIEIRSIIIVAILFLLVMGLLRAYPWIRELVGHWGAEFISVAIIQGVRPVVYRTTFSIFSGWLRLHFD